MKGRGTKRIRQKSVTLYQSWFKYRKDSFFRENEYKKFFTINRAAISFSRSHWMMLNYS